MLTRRNAVALLAGLTLTGLSLPATAQAPDRIRVVATFSILEDLVRNVGGVRVEVSALVGPNGDAHVYSPTPADGRRLANAQVVVANGLKFEGWIDRLIKSSGTKAAVVEAAKGVKALDAGDDDHAHGHRHDHGSLDPHAWQSVVNVKIYVENIRNALIAADPKGRDVYDANAAAYDAKLTALDKEIRDLVNAIPAERRKIITSHDAFRYFETYGIRFIAPQGTSTDAEASAKDVATIIRQIKKEKVPAVFIENVSDPRLMERISRETGAKIGGRVYSDALSDQNGQAGTYIEMMRHNIRAFSAALSS